MCIRDSFREQATIGLPLVVALRDAVFSGDLAAARAAYIAARNEYEQIEVLAPGFETVDCQIDCRPCAPRPLPQSTTKGFDQKHATVGP